MVFTFIIELLRLKFNYENLKCIPTAEIVILRISNKFYTINNLN